MSTQRIPAPIADGIASRDPVIGLRAVAALRALLERLERVHVDNARARGLSWQQIATALGVSKQAAHEKHAYRYERASREDER